jgi:hypothetical protein
MASRIIEGRLAGIAEGRDPMEAREAILGRGGRG